MAAFMSDASLRLLFNAVVGLAEAKRKEETEETEVASPDKLVLCFFGPHGGGKTVVSRHVEHYFQSKGINGSCLSFEKTPRSNAFSISDLDYCILEFPVRPHRIRDKCPFLTGPATVYLEIYVDRIIHSTPAIEMTAHLTLTSPHVSNQFSIEQRKRHWRIVREAVICKPICAYWSEITARPGSKAFEAAILRFNENKELMV
jgi:hypothetical protein